MKWIRPILPAITATHRFLFRFTKGGLGAGVFGLRFLRLEHVGRKSGLPRETPLLYVEDGDRFIVAASNAGRDRHPAWWLNLSAHPEAIVTAAGERVPVSARRALLQEEARLWLRLEESYRWFSKYREGTEREIPVVILEPLAPRTNPPSIERRTWYERVAVVTGAASGVGRALSEELAVRGCRLALIDINAEGLQDLATRIQALGGEVSTHIADVSNAERMAALPDEILAAHGHIHILVNNAGVTVAAGFEDHTLEELRWLIGINLWGVVHGCHFFLPHLLREEGAKLINVASSTALMGLPGQSVYSATKGAVRGLSESLSAELHRSNVKVTSIYPGGIRTGLFEAARGTDRAVLAQAGSEPRTARMFLSPQQVARAIIRAVERGRARALVGWDSHLVEWLWRLSPAMALRLSALAPVMRPSSETKRAGDAGVRRVEVQHRFNASPQAVWDVYSDHARWSEWAGTPGSRLVVRGHPDPNGVGAVRGFVGGMREEVLTFDPPKRMTYTVIAGLFPVKDHEGEVVFEADGDGTLVTWRCRFKSKIPGLGGLLERVVTGTFRRGLEGLERHSFS